jgi:hypothetical protein
MNVVDYAAESAEERTLRIHKEELKQARLLRVCLNCTATPVFYRELDNVGRLACRYHPGRLVDGAYSCCGHRYVDGSDGRALARGCVACDHSMPLTEVERNARHGTPYGLLRWHRDNIKTRLPLYASSEYMPLQECVIASNEAGGLAEPERSYIEVLRVDPRYYSVA